MLLTLFTFEGRTYEKFLYEAFENRLKYEVKEHNQIVTANQFYDSIKTLLNGFILSQLRDVNLQDREYVFINPSLIDFLIGYLNDSFSEKKSIISSLFYIQQLERLNPNKGSFILEEELQIILREKIDKNQLESTRSDDLKFEENSRITTYLKILIMYCSSIDTDTTILEIFKKLDLTKSWTLFLDDIEYFLLNLENAPETFNYIKNNFIKIIEKFISTISEVSSSEIVPYLFERYEHNYWSYLENNQTRIELVTNMIENVLAQSEIDLKYQHEDDIKDEEDIHSIYDEIYNLENSLSDRLLPETDIHYNFNISIDWNFWVKRIERNNQHSESDDSGFDDYDEGYYKEIDYARVDEEAVIDDLFSKSD